MLENNDKNKIKNHFKCKIGASEVPQWLRVFIALLWDQGLVTNTHILANNSL